MSPNHNWNQQWYVKTRATYIRPKIYKEGFLLFFIDWYNLKINVYPEYDADSTLHVYAKLCQSPSLDSRSCLKAYQWIRNEPIKIHYQSTRQATVKKRKTPLVTLKSSSNFFL